MNKIGILLLICFFAVSCAGSSQADLETTVFGAQGKSGFVGTVDGTDAFIALVIGENETIVYVCNGDEEIYEWFMGDVSDPENFTLANDAGAQVSASFDGSAIQGDVTLSNGTTYSYEATSNEGENAGIFQVYGDQAAQDGVKAGWIVNSEGDVRGAWLSLSIFQTTPTRTTVTYPVQQFTVAPNNTVGTNDYQGTDGAD